MLAETGQEHGETERVSSDPAVMGGAPCIRGTRIPVATVAGMIAEGMDRDEVLRDYPQLSVADVTAAVQYAARRARSDQS